LKQKKILLLLANGFEILEASAFIDVMGWNLEEGDNSTKLFSCGLRKEVNSSFNQKFVVNYLVNKVDIDSFNALVIPGGFKNYGYYEDAYNIEFLKIIREFRSQNKIIASVCVGALPLAKSGILKNKNATTYNQTEYRQILKNNGVVVSNEQIVIDDNLITSNGPSTAVEVAFILLKRLTSKENTLQVRKLMGF
jgi:4-methyl-5(b-hydroxyethyl)-thiazole monophosphate biosynthesis